MLSFQSGGASGKTLEKAGFAPVIGYERALEASNRLCEPYVSQKDS